MIEMTPAQILALPMQANDAGAATIQEYLGKLLWELWREKEGFSGKRPFGESSWQFSLYEALVRAGAIEGEIYDDGYLDSCDDEAGDRLIAQAIEHLMGPM